MLSEAQIGTHVLAQIPSTSCRWNGESRRSSDKGDRLLGETGTLTKNCHMEFELPSLKDERRIRDHDFSREKP
jgi:hypothetical protein